MVAFSRLTRKPELDKIIRALDSLDIITEGFLERYSAASEFLAFATSHYDNLKMRVSMKFFRYATIMYVLGYYEASVFYSALSVELALLRSAIKKWGEDTLVEIQQRNEKWRKKYPHGLTFWWLIHKAGILDKKNGDIGVAENIRLMRDSYVHYQNQLMFFDLEDIIEPGDYGKIPEKEIAKILEQSQMLRTVMNSMYPTPAKLVNPKCLRFIRDRRRKLEKRLLAEWKPKGANRSVDDVIRWVSYAQNEDFLEMLKWAKRILENPAYFLD